MGATSSEKGSISQQENSDSDLGFKTEIEAQSHIDNQQAAPFISEELRKRREKITWKIDCRLIPILGLMYSINGIDRTNLAVARITGMEEDLGIETGNRYSIALLIFFVPYFLFEMPSNLVIRKVGPARWLPFLSFAWGVCILGGGFSKSWGVIVVVRALTGAFEAGFFPGCIFLITVWYERYQTQKRIAVFFSVSLLAAGFGNILGYAINKLDGVAGMRGWRWVYIIEGLIPIAMAFLGYWLIIDFPDKVHEAKRPFLTVEEVQIVKDRLNADRGDAEYDHLTAKKVLHVMLQWQIWMYALLFMCSATCSYAFSYFMTVILRGMGYSTEKVFLLSAPPNIAAVPYSWLIAYFCDKTHLRGPAVMFSGAVCLCGLLMVFFCEDNNTRYGGIFMGLAGCNTNLTTVIAWQANNVRGQSTRAVASALQVGFGAIGGIYAGVTFIQAEAPEYPTGMWAACGTQIFLICSSAGLITYYFFSNKKADRMHTAVEGLERFRYTY